MDQEKIEGIKESLYNLLVEGDLSPSDALRVISKYLLENSSHAPSTDRARILHACLIIGNANQVLESTDTLKF